MSADPLYDHETAHHRPTKPCPSLILPKLKLQLPDLGLLICSYSKASNASE
jgi:hypothetical protein